LNIEKVSSLLAAVAETLRYESRHRKVRLGKAHPAKRVTSSRLGYCCLWARKTWFRTAEAYLQGRFDPSHHPAIGQAILTAF
jgi:hypothetical protein